MASSYLLGISNYEFLVSRYSFLTRMLTNTFHCHRGSPCFVLRDTVIVHPVAVQVYKTAKVHLIDRTMISIFLGTSLQERRKILYFCAQALH